jgi:ribosomal protein S27AE
MPPGTAACPKCAAAMTIVIIHPKIGTCPELHSFSCGRCHWMETRIAETEIATGGRE